MTRSGDTPLEDAPALARWAGVPRLVVKREDTNPTGSHKDRGAAEQLRASAAAGERVAVISSSGNAALAAAVAGAEVGVVVVALVSPLTEPGKLAALRAAGARVVVTEKPINHALRLSRVRGWRDLRPSLSPEALAGFRSLGEELAAALLPGTPVFGYASSGTTYQALGEVFVARGARLPLHPVQAGLVNGLSAAFGRPGDGRRSLVGDLGVKTSPRTARVVDLVRASGGSAWWVDDAEIAAAGAGLRDAGYAVARECWAALAGVRLATATLPGLAAASPCLVLTGRATLDSPPVQEEVAGSFAAVLERVADLAGGRHPQVGMAYGSSDPHPGQEAGGHDVQADFWMSARATRRAAVNLSVGKPPGPARRMSTGEDLAPDMPSLSGSDAVRATLAARGLRPAVAAHDLWIASGLERVLPETALLCIQRCDAVDVLRARGVEVFCLAEHADPETLSGASTADLFAHPATARFCAAAGRLGVVAFKPNLRLAAAVAGAGARLLGGDTPAARAFENKLAFVETARRAGLATPEWEVVDQPAGLTFAALSARFGPRLVLQGARGNAGQRTWMARDDEELRVALAAEGNRPVRVAGYVEGLPFTATGVAGPPGGPALLDWIEPCRQVTGIDWLTPMPLGSCGNAWGAAALRAWSGDVHEVLAALAAPLSAAGYAGLFGVDFVLGDDGPVVIETNPRLVASIPLATQMEVEAGRPGLLLRHLAAVLAAPGAGEVGADDVDLVVAGAGRPDAAADRPALPEASQVIIHRLGREAGRGSALPSGVYRLESGSGPVRLRDGVWFDDLRGPGEALLLAREAGQPVSPSREFARVYLRSSLAERHPGLRELVAAVRG
jgi:threonine synthase